MRKQGIYLVKGFLILLKYLLTDALKIFVHINSKTQLFLLRKYGVLEGKQVGITELGFGKYEGF